jgi:hypothetical protein
LRSEYLAAISGLLPISGQHLIGEGRLPEHPPDTHEKAVMNPLTVNPAIVLDHALRSGPEIRAAHARRTRRADRAVHAARSARVALERAGL